MSRDKKFAIMLFSILILICVFAVYAAVLTIMSEGRLVAGVLALIIILLYSVFASYIIYKDYKNNPTT